MNQRRCGTRPMKRELPLNRFNRKYSVNKNTGCWDWGAGKMRDGYGRFRWGGKTGRAHRFSYETLVEPIPKGFLVLHKCDNPGCVNPDHLFLGKDLDNHRDMIKKGRRVDNSGERHPLAKLNGKQVEEIRFWRSEGATILSLAKKYCVSFQQISLIVNNKNWKTAAGVTK